MKNRCEGCEFAKRISAQMGNWNFIGCMHEPYRGKWIDEIEDCPKGKDDKNKMTITIKGENLECVRNTLIIINNKVYERGGNIIDYEREILKALLGVNWEDRHIIGKQFIEEVEK